VIAVDQLHICSMAVMCFKFCYEPRVADITIEQFRQRYELPNKPVVLSAAAKGWPALEKWDKGYLAAAFAGRPVRCPGSILPIDQQ
jgi:hypothetical protein